MDKNLRPLVSVILPVYNSEKYLKQAIDSILNQTYGNFELLVFDDASTDKSADIIRSYSDVRIRPFYSEFNQGYVHHLNHGISLAKADIIARMDSDDIAEPKRFEEQINVFINNRDIDLVFTDSILIDNHDDIICPSWRPSLSWIVKALPYLSYIPHPSVMIRKAVYERYNGYDKNKSPAEDLDLWSKMKKDGANFYYLKRNLLKYRINPNSVQNVKGNIAFQTNYSVNIIRQCIAHNQKIKAIYFLRRFWLELSARDRFLLLLKIISPFYLSVIHGYLLAKERANGSK